jgi:hypothetical protein
MTDIVTPTVARLKAQVPDLRHIGEAAEFAILLDSNTLPQQLPAAFVIPVAADADPNDLLGGDQETTETIGIVLVYRHPATPAAARPPWA